MSAHTVAGDQDAANFLYVTCQVGAEKALKAEIARGWPAFHLAYSRPGFLTFKLPSAARLSDDVELASVFARAHGFVLGKATGSSLAARVQQVVALASERPFDALHAWQRDSARIGYRGFEPHLTAAAIEAEAAIRTHWQAAGYSPAQAFPRIAAPGQLVLDCLLVEPDLWWVGYHRARQGDSCFPGGLREISLPSEAISRAWLKMEESLAWSELPIRPGQRFAELGCAPGGASQALLQHGMKVVGIDPANVDPRLLADRNFVHLQKRGDDVRRREFRGITWLAVDMNVAPDSTLDTVEAIVTHSSTSIRGLLLTLKLLDWSLADHIDEFLARIRSWGYRQVRARQLAHNRQEICVVASGRRLPRRRKAQRK